MLRLNKKPRHYLRPALGIALVVFIALYIYFQFSRFLRGPSLKVESLNNNDVVTEPLLTISGDAENIDFAWLNGKQIYTDPKGRFLEEVLLLPGYNIIEIRARDRFGRSIEKRYEVILNEIPRDPEWFKNHLEELEDIEIEEVGTSTGTSTLEDSD